MTDDRIWLLPFVTQDPAHGSEDVLGTITNHTINRYNKRFEVAALGTTKIIVFAVLASFTVGKHLGRRLRFVRRTVSITNIDINDGVGTKQVKVADENVWILISQN